MLSIITAITVTVRRPNNPAQWQANRPTDQATVWLPDKSAESKPQPSAERSTDFATAVGTVLYSKSISHLVTDIEANGCAVVESDDQCGLHSGYIAIMGQ